MSVVEMQMTNCKRTLESVHPDNSRCGCFMANDTKETIDSSEPRSSRLSFRWMFTNSYPPLCFEGIPPPPPSGQTLGQFGIVTGVGVCGIVAHLGQFHDRFVARLHWRCKS